MGVIIEAKNKDMISKRIKALRKEKKMTLEDWADEFGVTASAASRWENETNPTKNNLKRIAEFCGVDIDEILYGTLEEYVKNFMKHFKILKNYVESEEYTSDLIESFSKDKEHPKITEIMSKILETDSDDYDLEPNNFELAWDNDIQKFIDTYNMEVFHLNKRPVDNLPNFRFSGINGINSLLMDIKRKDEYNEHIPTCVWHEKFDEYCESCIDYKKKAEKQNEDAFFNMNTFIIYLMYQETLLQDENSDSVKKKLERKGYNYVDFMKEAIKDTFQFEREVLAIMADYNKKREKIAKELGLNLADIKEREFKTTSKSLKLENNQIYKNKKEIYALFGKDKSNIRRALLPLDDKRAIWCGPIGDTDNSSKWENKFTDPEQSMLIMSNNNDDRFKKGMSAVKDYDLIVFTKNNDGYLFKGVFERIESNEETITFKRIQTFVKLP